MVSGKNMKAKRIPTVLAIGGSDTSAGAGIQADIKTIAAFSCYGLTAVTALTAQNTKGVEKVLNIDKEFVYKQIETIFNDIKIDIVKTGMLANDQNVKTVVKSVKDFNIKKLVVDPVMLSGSGVSLLNQKGIEILIKELFPLAFLVTPNTEEAGFITGKKIKTIDDMKNAVIEIQKMGPSWVVIKGGHIIGETTADVLSDGKQIFIEKSKRINQKNVHGTGCVYASAIAANLALGKDVPQAVKLAKKYVASQIKGAFSPGEGFGIMKHFV